MIYMRKYTIPPTIREKEKVIGGVLTMEEFMYIIGGLVVGIVVFICLMGISKVMGAIVGGIFALSGFPFAFIKPKGYSIPKYIRYKKQFKNKEKKLPNKRNI